MSADHEALNRHYERCGTEFCVLHRAAPDLLAALEGAPNPGYGQDAQRWTDEEYWPWWSKMRAAAIAKAKQ